MTSVTIALDAMGGDHGPKVIVPAALKVLARHPELHLILVGDQKRLAKYLSKCKAQARCPGQISVYHASEVVAMDELPSQALRYKKDSSMRVAIDLVKNRQAQACVSAGNTGALMATARFVLKTLPGIDRPAIIAELPALRGNTRMLDLGANVDSSAEHLFQFAVMGSVLTSAVNNNPKPRVGLLNIGVEEMKGNEQVKKTAQLLAESPHIHYVGYVEGDDISKGVVDVIVCDGFVGNVALKTSEGTAKLVAHRIESIFKQNLFYRLLAVLAYPVIHTLKKRLDPGRYNGASLLGINGIVIKSHGGANVLAFACAIEEALLEVEKNVPHLIRESVATLLKGNRVN